MSGLTQDSSQLSGISMQKKIAFVILVSVAVASVALIPYRLSQRQQDNYHWKELEHWGQMSENAWRSPNFQTSTEEWRIRESTGISMNLTVYNVLTGEVVGTANLASGNNAVLQTGPGVYYLRLQIATSNSSAQWDLHIEEWTSEP
jgi:hypothetical protein